MSLIVPEDHPWIELDSIIVEKNSPRTSANNDNQGDFGFDNVDGVFSPALLLDSECVEDQDSIGYISSSDNGSEVSTRRDHVSEYDLKSMSTLSMLGRQNTDQQFDSTTPNAANNRPFPGQLNRAPSRRRSGGKPKTSSKQTSFSASAGSNSGRSLPSLSLSYSHDDESSASSSHGDPLYSDGSSVEQPKSKTSPKPRSPVGSGTVAASPHDSANRHSLHSDPSRDSSFGMAPSSGKNQQTLSSWAPTLLDMTWRFKDRRLQKKLLEFNVDFDSLRLCSFLSCFLIVFEMFMLGVIVRDADQEVGIDREKSLALSIVLLFLSFMVQGSTLVLVVFKEKWSLTDRLTLMRPYKHWIQCTLLGLVEILAILFAVRRSVGDQLCRFESSKSIIDYFFCGNLYVHQPQSLPAMPIDAIAILMITPVLLASSFPSVDIMWHMLNFVASILTMIIAMAVSADTMPSILLLVIWIGSVYYLITDVHLKQIHVFCVKMQQRNSLIKAHNSSGSFGTISASISHSNSTSNHNLRINTNNSAANSPTINTPSPLSTTPVSPYPNQPHSPFSYSVSDASAEPTNIVTTRPMTIFDNSTFYPTTQTINTIPLHNNNINSTDYDYSMNPNTSSHSSNNGSYNNPVNDVNNNNINMLSNITSSTTSLSSNNTASQPDLLLSQLQPATLNLSTFQPPQQYHSQRHLSAHASQILLQLSDEESSSLASHDQSGMWSPPISPRVGTLQHHEDDADDDISKLSDDDSDMNGDDIDDNYRIV